MTTTTDIAVRNGHTSSALAIRPGQEMFSDKQRAALAVLGITGATNAELAVYMHYCQRTGLDPFSRQIYMIARREKQGDQWVTKQTIQVGIDGFRVIRDRIARREAITVEYEDTIWYDADGSAHKVWLWEEAPAACVVTVIKDGKRFPGAVRTAAYAATNRDGDMVAQWRNQPDHMIEKCAEAFALRRAFPHDLGGLYIDEEMPGAPPAASARPRRVTAAEIIGDSQQAPAAGDDTQPSGDSQDGRDRGNRGAPPPPPQGGPADRPAARAGKTALAKLDGLMRKLPLGEPTDVTMLLEWLCGGAYTASRSQCEEVTSFLEDHLRNAQGDVAEAASAVWAQYRSATAQDAAEASQDAADGGEGGTGG